jgi:pyruvate/2-oxoglutarate dehydrogenase complex dihydrolipoamide acyltransferase (E2) component
LLCFALLCSQLKPRSQAAASAATHASAGKSNPFGAAKPREEVLASKGIDPKLVEERIEKKAHAVHYTRVRQTNVVPMIAHVPISHFLLIFFRNKKHKLHRYRPN